MALARRRVSLFARASKMAGRAGRLHKNLASRSMSPESSRTLQTDATWAGGNASIGRVWSGKPNIAFEVCVEVDCLLAKN